MTFAVESARGASVFTRTDGLAFSPAVATSLGFLTAEHRPFRGWTAVIDELLRIRTLADDWDGEGTEAPHPSLVDGAITLAQSLEARGLPPADRVLAGVNGTVYFEWHTPLGYQEIEVTSPLDAECRWVEKGSDATTVVSLSRRL